MIRNLLTGVRLARALNRQSSDRLVALAQRALRRPESLSPAEVKSLAASVLSQARTEPDEPGPIGLADANARDAIIRGGPMRDEGDDL